MSVDYLPMKSDNHDSQKLGGLFVTGGKDGLVKVWNIKKELIREIKFPEPITAVCFLNSSADLLVGHIGKVSSVSTVFAKDYKPYEQIELASPSELDIEKFMADRTVVTDNIFLRLKKQDDKIKKQYLDIVKKSPQK